MPWLSGARRDAHEEATMPRAQIEDERTYQELREKGESKEKSAVYRSARLVGSGCRLRGLAGR